MEDTKKTKRQIEAEYPIIKPEECPGAIMKWIAARDAKRDEAYEDWEKKIMELIEQTIDRLFEKHFRKYVSMIFGHRIWLFILSFVVGAIIVVLWYHLAQ